MGYIVFVDEAGFMLAPLVRRTWAPRGQTPVITVAEPHGRISVIGAMTISPTRRRFGFYYHLLADNVNFHGDSVVSFVNQIQKRLPGPFTILWDTIGIHHDKAVEKYLNTHPRIHCAPFPPYAPELNPVDQVWSYVKYDRLANYCPSNLTELRKRIEEEFRKLQKQPQLLKALYNGRENLDTETGKNKLDSTYHEKTTFP
jgi:transposase